MRYSLRQTATRYLKFDREGSYQKKKQRAYVIHKMIDDLYAIGKAPSSWKSLCSEDIHHLVRYWKKSGLKSSTIMNHLTVIRRYLKKIDCPISNIDNTYLSLRKNKQTFKKYHVAPQFWKEWQEPIQRLIMAFQTEFGLRFHEIIQLKPFLHLKSHCLWITRDIAFNKTDRMIPIRNDQQRKLIAELFEAVHHQNLFMHFGKEKLYSEWRMTLKKHNLPTQRCFRYLYAKERYRELLPLIGNYKAYQTIQDEMGIRSRNTLWTYLYESNKTKKR